MPCLGNAWADPHLQGKQKKRDLLLLLKWVGDNANQMCLHRTQAHIDLLTHTHTHARTFRKHSLCATGRGTLLRLPRKLVGGSVEGRVLRAHVGAPRSSLTASPANTGVITWFHDQLTQWRRPLRWRRFPPLQIHFTFPYVSPL